ncbi:hypothetical protein J2751_000642 [Halorubrum alkaliphilum]|uniref:Uncharacterized protein n=1 Tax=Halorubrum alkaliphilum TaxID=261290 RepID=A0A8T4GD55_9EURY|nr:hypothetical protein [Halorubrum alkaliphilum]
MLLSTLQPETISAVSTALLALSLLLIVAWVAYLYR